MDDDLLIARARRGDRDALDALLRLHYDRIYSVCRRLAGNDADAADAAQEALLAIVRGLDRFDGRAAFGTWAYRVATNACLDELRRRSRRPRPVDEITDQAQPGFDTGVAERMSLDAALSQLPLEFRQPVVLRDVGGHDYAQIAELLGVPIGTVKSRIARGRAHLATLLGNQSGHDLRRNEHDG
jgi:RNA polymerase sigma-70 factor (ECF subfamily)